MRICQIQNRCLKKNEQILLKLRYIEVPLELIGIISNLFLVRIETK